jgi:hypothetical protein
VEEVAVAAFPHRFPVSLFAADEKAFPHRFHFFPWCFLPIPRSPAEAVAVGEAVAVECDRRSVQDCFPGACSDPEESFVDEDGHPEEALGGRALFAVTSLSQESLNFHGSGHARDSPGRAALSPFPPKRTNCVGRFPPSGREAYEAR